MPIERHTTPRHFDSPSAHVGLINHKSWPQRPTAQALFSGAQVFKPTAYDKISRILLRIRRICYDDVAYSPVNATKFAW